MTTKKINYHKVMARIGSFFKSITLWFKNTNDLFKEAKI